MSGSGSFSYPGARSQFFSHAIYREKPVRLSSIYTLVKISAKTGETVKIIRKK